MNILCTLDKLKITNGCICPAFVSDVILLRKLQPQNILSNFCFNITMKINLLNGQLVIRKGITDIC